MPAAIDSAVTVEARAPVHAPADRVYDLIADYRNGHPRIVPPKYFRNLVVERGGRAPTYTEAAGQRVMKQAEIAIRVDLGRGDARATVWTCDFSHDYVTINAEYRS